MTYSHSVENVNMVFCGIVANLLNFVFDHIKTQKMSVEEARKDPF